MRRERRGLVSAGWARGHPHTHTSGLAGIFSSGPRFSSKSSFSKKVIVRFNTAPSPPTLREPAVAATLYIERARLPWAGWPGPLGFWNALERNDIGYRESERPHTRRLVTARTRALRGRATSQGRATPALTPVLARPCALNPRVSAHT